MSEETQTKEDFDYIFGINMNDEEASCELINEPQLSFKTKGNLILVFQAYINKLEESRLAEAYAKGYNKAMSELEW